ncbi:DNA-directed RNA polymerases II and IV subunit 5A-like [Prunus yedoensis var. nudiflora]|uniref:DNA-directed RNA polymerases II and IV subunit 5A-like n=1 Tax=Prunus yedoensis var. nudiflora TaxID=2094558 RepID=A0A314XWT8_PRUYE|nr:DNA-directed RNA polymerases II and IV subunit 5A-like [Prunus yedoensis var. nudiflora]
MVVANVGDARAGIMSQVWKWKEKPNEKRWQQLMLCMLLRIWQYHNPASAFPIQSRTRRLGLLQRAEKMVLPEEEITRLYRVRRTVMQMLRDRHYLVGDFEINMTREQFKAKYGENMKREDLTINKTKRNDSTDQLYVFFPEEPKVGVKTIKTYTNRMKSANVSRAILVTQQNMTPMARTCISEISSKFHMEVFQEPELMVNVTEHVLVPEHQLLSNEEKKTLLERYTVKETQLPRIQLTDPVAKYYGLKRGQVLKIIRPSETAGRYITYRYLV